MSEPLNAAERAAIVNAGDHSPEICDCTGYAAEVEYAPGYGEICGGLEDTYAVVVQIADARVAAERDALLAKFEALAEEWNAASGGFSHDQRFMLQVSATRLREAIKEARA